MIEPMSRPPAPAPAPSAPPPSSAPMICAPTPPPTIPAIEFPRVPRSYCFNAAPAMFPPTPPEMSWMMSPMIPPHIAVFLPKFALYGTKGVNSFRTAQSTAISGLLPQPGHRVSILYGHQFLSARSLRRRPAHDRNRTDAVFRAAFDEAIAVGNINQNVTLPVEKANDVEGFEDEAASLVEDAFAVSDLADNLDRPDLAARYAGVAGILCDAQSTLDASGLCSGTWQATPSTLGSSK